MCSLVELVFLFCVSVTNTARAIDVARKMLLAHGRFTGDVTHVIVVITDGSSINTYKTGEESQKAQENFIRMVALGVGQNAFYYELEKIASDESSLMTVNNFMELYATDNFLETICDGNCFCIY